MEEESEGTYGERASDRFEALLKMLNVETTTTTYVVRFYATDGCMCPSVVVFFVFVR